jgi:hypothetical protein
MKYNLFGLFLGLLLHVNAQEIREWQSGQALTLTDFASPQTQIDSILTNYSVYHGGTIELNFQMNSVVFMFTKHFNDKISAKFNPKAAVIVASDTTMAQQFVAYANYEFDLVELYARKLRKKVYEEKKTFSDTQLFQAHFNQFMAQMHTESARVAKASDIGRKPDVLQQEHDLVTQQIEALADFCKSCKPPKKRKKNKTE